MFAPLKRHMTPGCAVGVIGIGGLGHLALQFAKALGAHHVYAITSSPSKQKAALQLGADTVLTPAEFENAGNCVDVMICTVCHHSADWKAYLGLMRPHGKFCVVGGMFFEVEAINKFKFPRRIFPCLSDHLFSRRYPWSVP